MTYLLLRHWWSTGISKQAHLALTRRRACRTRLQRWLSYTPLDSDQNEIRLLSLLPEQEGCGVSCSLEHVSLITPPGYVALSYCWGDASVTKEITINGESVQVTENLESALRHLRAKGYRRLWIDALCINQEDKTEKSQQLLWMGSIYRRANEVAAWTGDETPEFAKAVQFMDSPWDLLRGDNEDPPVKITAFFYDSIYLDNPFVFGGGSPYGQINDRSGVEAAVKTSELSHDDHLENIHAFKAFLARPYWRRIWVIQELALARKSTIHCGNRTIDWLALKSVIEKCRTATRSSMMYHHITTPEFSNAQNLVQFHTDSTNGKPLRFLEALQRSLGSLSTEPRDKVFALLGLVFDGGIFIPVPNYRQSLKSICVSITMSAISSTSSLDFVAMLGSGSNNEEDLPSWVPNWFHLDEASAKRAIGYLLRSKAKGMNSSPADGFLHSTGAKGPVFTTNGTRLLAKGFIFDRIQNLSSTISEGPAKGDGQRQSVPNPYGSEHELLDAISRAWTRHTKSSVLPRRDKVLHLIFDFWTHDDKLDVFTGPLRTWLASMKTFSTGDLTLQELATKVLLRSRELSEDGRERQITVAYLYQLLQAVDEVLRDGMRFMTTTDGFVGWCHPRAKPDDQICILRGCSVPVIVRLRAEGGYSVVGDAYVEGIMKGEALIGLQGHDWEQIEIY